MSELKTTADVARTCGCTVWALYDAIRNGRITPPARVGKTYLWAERDVAHARDHVGKDKKGVASGQ